MAQGVTKKLHLVAGTKSLRWWRHDDHFVWNSSS